MKLSLAIFCSALWTDCCDFVKREVAIIANFLHFLSALKHIFISALAANVDFTILL